VNSTPNHHAIVIGGSIAGLLTARVLSDHFAQVTLIEQDLLRDIPEPRRGQPQAVHLHGLLGRGLQILQHYFPDLVEALRQGGATVNDMGKTMRWHCNGGYRAKFEFGADCVIASRPFLEWLIRQRVFSLANVTVVDGCRVSRLLSRDDRRHITGVQVSSRKEATSHEEIHGDLVVDATGRNSRSPQWLSQLGYDRPPESRVTCGTSYATRLYQRNMDDSHSGEWIFCTPTGPTETRGGGALPIEGQRWIVALSGRNGDAAPTREQEFLAFAESLPAPEIAHILHTCEPVSGIYNYHFPASQRRHYDRLAHFPEGYLVLGDAFCSFNPLYGQGMTTAALQAEALDRLLSQRRGDLRGIAHPFFKQAATLINIPWQTAVGEDFRYLETEGKKSLGTDLINAYVTRVNQATHHDPAVGAAFLAVMNMMAPPTSLFQPITLWRVLGPGSTR
jgi:2-polyprenyl-6-methoxyphenol hydroxylase-like FAD-dependent oxidoreductase